MGKWVKYPYLFVPLVFYDVLKNILLIRSGKYHREKKNKQAGSEETHDCPHVAVDLHMYSLEGSRQELD